MLFVEDLSSFGSSDKNMLVLASSVHLQGVTLDDFLNGNYTIEAKEPIQEPQPKAGPDHRPDSGQEVLWIGPISKVSQFKVNLEKDLERKDQEYSQFVKVLLASLWRRMTRHFLPLNQSIVER